MTEPTTIIPTIPKRTSTRIQKDKTQEGGGKRLKLKDVCDESGDQNANDKAGSGAGDGEKEEEVVVEKVIEGVDPRMRREKVMLEDDEDEEDEESEEEEVDESPSDSSVPERVCTQPRSARDMMDGFMDHDDDNENETPTELGNVLRESDNRQDGNRMVDGVGMTGALNKALSHRAAGHCREKHMTDRIVDYCKTQLFRKVKFITGEEMTTKAVVTVMDALKIQAHERPDFVKLYTTCVTGSINTKRSTCEQAGSKIVRDLLIKKKHKQDDGVPPYRMESLEQLRRSYKGSAEDLEAFLWFFGTFLDCVSGARAWGGQRKYVEEVSKAEIKGVGGKIKLVTVSDEAFGLLLYENYVDKWIQKFQNEKRSLQPSAISMAEKRKSSGTKIRGKYTKGSVGHCEFGGWSERGLRRFNELCEIADADRRDPKAQNMEAYLLQVVRETKYGKTVPAIESDDESSDELLNGRPAILAYCEL
jgi:hypothetical protein